MKDDRKEASGSPDIEVQLGRLTAVPVPPGLRRRVLDAAQEARKEVALTPRLRALAGVCAILIVMASIADPLMGRFEAVRMAAILGVTGISAPTERGSDSLWAELGVGTGIIDRALRRRIARFGSKGREASLTDHLQVRDWLKGMIDYENAEGLN